jgi:hypothetical protein
LFFYHLVGRYEDVQLGEAVRRVTSDTIACFQQLRLEKALKVYVLEILRDRKLAEAAAIDDEAAKTIAEIATGSDQSGGD